ncbi:MAG: TonB family protein [Candidatus Cloacimonetes bacterium]|nr:TonB family protein [Candidatus Cloacimonadota bacterium]
MSEKTYSLFISSVLHLVLVLLLIVAVYKPKIDFNRIEIIEFGIQAAANNQNLMVPAVHNQLASGFTTSGSKTSLIPEKVDLPRAVTEDEVPLHLSNQDLAALNELELDEKVGSNIRDGDHTGEIIAPEISHSADKPVLGTSEDYLNTMTRGLQEGSAGESPYILEGDILSRNILTRILPEYPSGIQQNTSVKIRFQVLADGSVSDLMVVRKADPVLEEISLQALRKWKFNPVSGETVQIGYITFIYRLK